MAKHSDPDRLHYLRKPTTVETCESYYADKDVALTVWQGNHGNTTNHSWQELQQLHSEIELLLRSAGQLPVEYEYALHIRDSDRSPWIYWDQDSQVWGTKDRVERYLAGWVGKAACWRYLEYRVLRRPKAGAAEMVVEGTGHDTAPAQF